MSDPIQPREFSFDVKADLELVWSALTTGTGLATWYCHDAELEATVGGTMSVDWGTGTMAMGTIDAFEPPARMRLVYGSGEVGAEEWLLHAAGGVTHVRLIHSMPVADGTWDDTYPDIVRGWHLFHQSLVWALETHHRIGRRSTPTMGTITPETWPRVLDELGLDTDPADGDLIEVPSVGPATVVVAVPDLSVLLAFEAHTTLLVDVEGPTLYTLTASYIDGHDDAYAAVTDLASRMCGAS